jgi:hypothetical protein
VTEGNPELAEGQIKAMSRREKLLLVEHKTI